MVTIALPIVGLPLAKRLEEFTGGSQGTSARFSGAPDWSGLDNDQWQYYIVLAITVVAFLLARNLVRGKFGRAMAIVRDNEAVATSMGISPYRYKVLAFTIASLFGGASGFLYMVAVQYTSPETMSFAPLDQPRRRHGDRRGRQHRRLADRRRVLRARPRSSPTRIDASLTLVLQGIILLAVLFLLPGGLVSLPRTLRRLTRRRQGQRRSHRPDPADRSRVAGPPTPTPAP